MTKILYHDMTNLDTIYITVYTFFSFKKVFYDIKIFDTIEFHNHMSISN